MTDIENKIRKLLALAGDNPNLNEAAVAFERAQALATKHMLNLEEITSQEEQEEPPAREVGPIGERTLDRWDRAVAWKVKVASAVARANGCRIYYMPGRGGFLRTYGQEEDMATTHLLYNLITSRVDMLAKEAVRVYKGKLIEEYGSAKEARDWGEDTPRTFGRSFRIGAAHAISSRLKTPAQALEAAHEEANASYDVDGSTTALARVEAAGEYLARLEESIGSYRESLGLSKGSGFVGASSSSGYASGRQAGSTVSLGTHKELS